MLISAITGDSYFSTVPKLLRNTTDGGIDLQIPRLYFGSKPTGKS
jgi:hypothetical protein